MRLAPRKRRTAGAEHALLDALREIRDGLRAGRSLPQALAVTGRANGSPLHAVAMELESTSRPLSEALRTASAATSDPDLGAALAVLSVHASSGGDPGPSIRALESRLRGRIDAAREVRALTTQARVSARAVLLLTPGFLLLLGASDPRGLLRALTMPSSRLAIVAGIALQCAGGAWMSHIVRAPLDRVSPRGSRDTRRSRMARAPVLRAFAAIVRGKRDPEAALAVEVASLADLLAVVVDAGPSPARAIELVSASVPGPLGEAVRSAASEVRRGLGTSEALRGLARGLDSRAVSRLAGSLASAGELGVPVSDTLRALAEDIRSERAQALTEDVRRASVKVLVPLSLLVLPAFVLACLVPLFLSGLQGLSL